MPGIRPIEFDRDAALEAALDAFWEGGYANTKLPRLLEATGVARQSLYNTFGDKRGLFLESIHRYSDLRIAEHHAALAPDPPLETLIRFVDRWRHRRRQTRGRGCFACLASMELARRDGEVASAVERHTHRLAEAFAASLGRAGLPKTKAAGLAASLVATHHGIGVLSRSAGTGALIAAAADAAMRMLEQHQDSPRT